MAYEENKNFENKEENQFEEKLVKLSRVAKVVKGGRRFSFSALMVLGDKAGNVGIGFGKANEVTDAIRKGLEQARKNMVSLNLRGDTIPHDTVGYYRSSKIILKPASKGTGVIAGGPARAVLEVAGVKNILSKSLGNNNALNLAKATLEGLKSLDNINDVAKKRGKTVEEIYGVSK